MGVGMTQAKLAEMFSTWLLARVPSEHPEHDFLPRWREFELLKPRVTARLLSKAELSNRMSASYLAALRSFLQDRFSLGADFLEVTPRERRMQPHQLRSAPEAFTGREAELAQLHALARQRCPLGVFGPGGVGKTSVALFLASAIATDFPDGQILLDVHGYSGAQQAPLSRLDVFRHVIRSLWPDSTSIPDGEEQLAALYRSALSGRRVLLLIDNVESERQVESIIPPEGSLLLLTSRRHLSLYGLRGVTLDELEQADAETLLKRLTGRRLSRRASSIAKLCGRYPLAIEVVASRLNASSEREARHYLSKLRKVDGQSSLVEASVRLSVDSLEAPLRTVWSQLSAFPGAFDAAAAGAVLGLKKQFAKEHLGALVGYSLLAYDEATDRYRLHDVVRAVAAKQLSAAETGELRTAHARHFGRVLESIRSAYDRGGAEMTRALERFDRELRNIEYGPAWVSSRWQTHARLCAQYPDQGVGVLALRLTAEEYERWLRDGLRAAELIEAEHLQGLHLANIGMIRQESGRFGEAIEYLDRALPLLRHARPRRLEAPVLHNLGTAHANLGDRAKASRYFARAKQSYRRDGDSKGVLRCEASRLATLLKHGDHQRALRGLLTMQRRLKRAGDKVLLAMVTDNVGCAHQRAGDHAKAIDYHNRALAMDRELGNAIGQGESLDNLGSAYAGLGEQDRAEGYYLQAIELFRERGDRYRAGACRSRYAETVDALHGRAKAIETLRQAIEELGDCDGQDGEVAERVLQSWSE